MAYKGMITQQLRAGAAFAVLAFTFALSPASSDSVSKPDLLCPFSQSAYLDGDNLVGTNARNAVVSGSAVAATKLISTEDNSVQGFVYLDDQGLQWIGLLPTAKDYPNLVLSHSPFPMSAFDHPLSAPLPPRTRLSHCNATLSTPSLKK